MFSGFIIAIIFSLIWFLSKDDKEQIAKEIKEHWDVTNIHHIEVINNNKAIAFFKTVDGTEMEMYLEKSLFSWRKKRDYTFIPEGVNESIHLSFFDSPYNNEEEYNAVLLRVFDIEIDSVQIVNGEEIIHYFKRLTKGSGERFELFTTESDAIYDAEYLAYNSEGEVVFSINPTQ